MGTERTDGGPEEQVRRSSDALLQAIHELQALEREKRAQQVSSPEFHAMARAITERSREVFRLAAEEEKAGVAVDGSELTADDDQAD